MAEVQRSREFIPEDSKFRNAEEISDRVEELRKKKDSFDSKKQFVGLKRLGASYTVAEPFAFFDGPTSEENKVYRYMVGCALGVGIVFSSLVGHVASHRPAITGLARGLLAMPVLFVAGTYLYDKKLEMNMRRQNMLFHYALMHEENFPKIQRKKYGEIIQDWTPHRSLNQFGPGQWKWF